MNDAMERLRARQNRPGDPAGDVLDAIMGPRPAAQGDIIQVPGGKLHSFSGHTFQLRPEDDPYMVSLAASIRENGILEPLLVRPHPAIPGDYEIIAGHTRHHLGTEAGMVSFPCIVRALDDADAIIQMGESNVQRPDWLPSERARTYKAHLEALRQKRSRQEPGSCLEGQTRDLAAQRWGITGKALEMYVRLADLEPGLLSLMDSGRIPAKAGYQLTFLPAERQSDLLDFFVRYPALRLSVATAKELRGAPEQDYPRILGLLDSPDETPKQKTWTLVLPRELLPEGAKQYLADPELQRQIIDLVNRYVTAAGTGSS